MEGQGLSKRRKSLSISPVDSDIQRNIEQEKKIFGKGEVNIDRFNKTAIRSYMTNGKTIEINLKTDHKKHIKKKYQIIKLLGEGVFGLAYLAVDPEINKLYVIKFQSKKFAKKEIKCLQVVEPICGEYILCYVGHFDYNIGFNVFSGLVTEFEESLVTLGDHLEVRTRTKDYLTLNEKEDILQNVKIVLEQLNNQGIVHNDLHHGNILWNISEGPKKGNIKLIDFGLCLFGLNKLKAKELNDQWLQKLATSLDTFLSRSDQNKINKLDITNLGSKNDLLLFEMIKKLNARSSSKSPSKRKDSSLSRLKGLNDSKNKSEDEEFSFIFPSVPQKKLS
jgi:serine/threonine protein kinase